MPQPYSMESKKIFCDISKCQGCKTCELACAVEHSASKDLFLALLESPLPKKRRDTQFIEQHVSCSISCQYCQDPPCVEACMASCISKDEKSEKVEIDQTRCVGCSMCIMVCPFAAISSQAGIGEKSLALALKCDLCPDRDSPACVDSCPSKALSFETRSEFEKKHAK